MLVACWSVKGGSGTTVTAAALALLLARRATDGVGGVLLADLAGDLPAVLGLPEPGGPGLAEWSTAGADVPVDALTRLELPAAPGLALLPRGDGPFGADRARVLAGLLDVDARPAVVDAGRLVHGGSFAAAVAAAAPASLLVTRPCYLALRRAQRCPLAPTGVVVLTEADRALTAADVEAVLDVPVVAEVGVQPEIARAVDAGLLASRLPRRLARGLRGLAS